MEFPFREDRKKTRLAGGKLFRWAWFPICILFSLETLRPSQSEAFIAGLRSGRSTGLGIHRGSGLGSGYDAKVDILEFSRPFSGSFKGSRYTANLPPRRVFPNHPSCKSFSAFISSEILSRLTTGAFRIWGEVGSEDPPHLVMPLTVEPSKPRLCLDARFLNL